MDFVKRIRDAFTAKGREIERLTTENGKLTSENSRLKSENSSLKSRNSSLESEVKRFHQLAEEVAPTSATTEVVKAPPEEVAG